MKSVEGEVWPMRTPVVFFTLVVCAAGLLAEEPVGPTVQEKLPAKTAGTAVADEGADLISDQPGATGVVKERPYLLDEMQGEEPLSQHARKCYELLAEMRNLVERLRNDLDDGGKEVARLVRTSDKLSKNIGELAELWPTNEPYRDLCGSAKSRALTLNDNLAESPRKWTHVRWSFNEVLSDIRALRVRSRELADVEPKLVPLLKNGKPVVDKDGKPVLREPDPEPMDPALARRLAERKKVDEAREKLRKREEKSKDTSMPVDLDGNAP